MANPTEPKGIDSPTDVVIGKIIRDVCEIPDRNSPDDWPEAMIVTTDELQAILEIRLAEFPATEVGTPTK